MPRYMAIGTNKQFADATNGSMNAARVALVLALVAVEGMIDIYMSTLLCFLELVIRVGMLAKRALCYRGESEFVLIGFVVTS